MNHTMADFVNKELSDIVRFCLGSLSILRDVRTITVVLVAQVGRGLSREVDQWYHQFAVGRKRGKMILSLDK